MNEFAELFLFRMGLASAYLSGAALIAWGMLHALRCQSPFVHRTVWCLVLAQSLLVFQFPVVIPYKQAKSHAQNVLGPAAFTPEAASSTGVAIPQAILANSRKVEYSQDIPNRQLFSILLVAWFSGVLLVFGQWSLRYIWFVRNLTNRKCDEELWNNEWDGLLAESDCSARIPLYFSDSAGPLLCRWLNGVRIVVPESLWRRLPREQRQVILRHELAHYERHDLSKTLIANLIAAVHWFNPLAWFAVRRFEDSIEWTCDRIVQSSKPDAKVHYAKALLALGSHSSIPTTWASAISGGGLAGRIRRVLSANDVPDSRFKVLATLGMLVAISVVHVVRIELIAQEAIVQSKAVVSADYFIAPVVTEFQHWQLRGIALSEPVTVAVYANVNGRSFFNKQQTAFDMNRFDFDSFVSDLASVRRGAKTGITAICLELEIIHGSEASVHEVAGKVEAALQLRMMAAGIENFRVIKRFVNDGTDWKNLAAETTTNSKESQLGIANVCVFPVETALSQFLISRSSSGNARSIDCLIDIATIQPQHAKDALTAMDKEVIRAAVSELKLPSDSSILLIVHFEKPKDWSNIPEQFPQTKKDSSFQCDAVDFLKSLGFAQVGMNVDVSSCEFTSMHD